MKEYFGIYQGVVTNIKDPEKRGRIKCIIPDIIGATIESAWCDPCVPVSYDKGGDFCIPAINETVWILFRKGNPNKPVYMGGWWRKDTVPKETYDELDNYRIISYADCKIVLVNGKIHIETSDNSIIEMKEGKITLETSEGDTEVTIENKKVTIKGDLYVEGEIYGKKSAHLDKSVFAKENVEADINVSAKNNVSADNNVNAKKNVNADENVNGSVVTGTTKISTPLGEFTTGNAMTLNIHQIFADNISTTDVSASNVEADYVSAGGVSLATHTHKVTTTSQGGTYDTTTPTIPTF